MASSRVGTWDEQTLRCLHRYAMALRGVKECSPQAPRGCTKPNTQRVDRRPQLPYVPRLHPSQVYALMSELRTTPLPRDYAGIAPRLPEGPVALPGLFPKATEIELEIGFGRGMFLIQRATAAPHVQLLGLEIKSKWAYLVDQRCRRLGLDHVQAFGGDVREILPRLQPDGCVARVFMHFPDPWWKKRHARRRLVGAALLDEIGRLLRPDGEFFLQTDVEERADVHAEALTAHPAFRLEGEGGRLADNPYGAVSNREKRAAEDGLPVFRVLARRVG